MGALGQTATQPAGSGTAADPYQIATLDNLCWLMKNSSSWSSHFKQTANIEAKPTFNWPTGWQSVGHNATPFTGTYDGQGFTINELWVKTPNTPEEKAMAIFGKTQNATLTRIGITNAYILYNSSKEYSLENIAILVAHNVTSTISSCYATGYITSVGKNRAGLVAFNEGGTISRCYCSSGIVQPIISGYYGGLVGKNTGTVISSFYNNISGCTDNDGRGTPKSTAEMKDITTYTSAGWDFASIWGVSSPNASPIVNEGYPTFLRQFTTGIALPTVSKPTTDGVAVKATIDPLGNPQPYEVGFCYSTTNTTPTVSDSKLSLGAKSSAGELSAILKDLTPATPYYVRAYAINAANPTSITYSPVAQRLAQLTITAPTVTTTKEYDGNNVAAITSPGEVSGIVGGDDVRVIANARYADANAGTEKNITVTYTLEGASASSYLTPAPRTLTGEIKPKEITVTANPIQKTYGDNNLPITYTTAPVASSELPLDGALSRAVGEDVGSYLITIGTLKPTTGNYKLTLSKEYYNIVAKQLSYKYSSAIEKVYDGTTNVTTLPSIEGIIPSDNASVAVAITGSYNDKNVGSGKTASFSCTISGAKAGNYLLPAPADITTAAITQAPLAITPNNIEKRVAQAYNFAGTEFTSKGLVEGDELTSVTLTSDGAAATAAVNTYSIAASNAQGTGLSNYSISYNTGTLTVIDIVPAAPTAVTATAGDEQATVNFTPPTDNGGSPVTSYTVTANPGGKTATGTQSPIVVAGLTNGTAYTFTVTATNKVGTGNPSAPSTAVTPFYKPNVLIVASSDQYANKAAETLKKDISATFDVTVSTTGVPASLDGYSQIYDVRVSPGVGLTADEQTLYASFLQAKLGNSLYLAGEQPYYQASNQSISDFIAKVGGGTVAPPAVKSTSKKVALKAPFNTGASSISAVVLDGYGVITESGKGSVITTEADGTSGAGLYFPQGTLANAPNGCLVVMYDISFIPDNYGYDRAFRINLEQVMAAGGTLPGPSATSVSLSATTSPAAVSAPVPLTATVTAGATEATGEVQFMEGATVLGTATLEKGVATLKGASTTFTTLGTHTITAKYFGDAGHNASTSEAFKLVVCTAPDAPTIGSATAGDAKAEVKFTPAASDGGSPITGYTVTATPEKSGKSVTLTVPATGIEAGKEHTLEVTGLTNGTKYSFTVTASNAALTSVPSAAATTPIRLTHQPEITWDINTDIVYGTALDKTMLNPTADVPGSFSYNYSLGTVLNVGDGQMLIATFTPTDQDANIGTTAIKNINVAKATPTISWNPPTIAYGTALGEAQLGAAALHKGATVFGTFTYTANDNALKVGDILAAGNHTLKVAFVPMPPFYALNFNSVEATATLTVDKATPAITWKAPLPITYGTKLSNEQLSATANVGGTFTYTPAIGTTLTAGEHILRATFTPTDAANYSSVEATATLTVDKATPAITWKAPSAIIYGTKLGDKQLSATADVEGAFTYTPALGATLAAGEHTLKATFTPTDATNYSSVEATATLTVDKATPATTWKAPSPITYGTKLGNEQLSATADAEGTFTYTPAEGTLLNAGQGQALSVTFTPTDRVNYNEVTKTVAITVAKAPLTVTASSHTITKGENIPALGVTYKGFVNGEDESVLDTKPTATTSATSTSNAGNYDIVAANGSDGNYELAYVKGKLTINKITPTITWSEPATITYGTPVSDVQLNATVLHNGAKVAGTLSYNNGNTLKAGDILAAGDHILKVTFTPTDAVNYSSVEKTVRLTVAKALLTVTASSHNIVKGEVIPTPSVSYSGFVNGEDEAVVDAKPTVSTAATSTSNAGTYDIVAVNGADNNYDFTYVKGTLTISKITPTISWANPATITYGTKLGNAQLSATADAEGTFTYTPAEGTLLNAGQGQALSVTFTPTDRVNYNEVTKTVAITVAKAPLTVTASSHTITKGENIPALGVTYKGFVNSEDQSVLDTKPTATTSATATSPVGEYATIAADGIDGNYSFTYVDGKLTILDKRIPTITWAEPNGITYGTPLSDAQLNATASYSGAAVAGSFTYAPAAGTTLAAGKHDLKVTFTPTDGDHYVSVEKAVSITIAKAPLTTTANSYSIREGEAIPALGVTYKGFVNGDTEAVLDTKPTATTTATATSPTGVYDITVAGGADDSYEFAYVAGKLTISNPIVVNALKAPQPACEGDKLSLAYTLTSGRPTEYQIVFDAKALTAGFSNSGYAALPTDDGAVSFSIPARVTDGTYQATLQLRDGYGNISEPAAFQVTVNVSADVIVPKFGSVVLIDNHDGRFTGYQWYRNGSAIGGATSQFYKDPNGLSGTYYAQLKTATGQTVNTCSKALSIKKSAQASVSVYPNPARAGQEFTVKLSGFADEELQGAVLTVYSTQGIPVLTSRKVEQENRITLSGTDGVYMGRIATADGQVLTFKVVLAN